MEAFYVCDYFSLSSESWSTVSRGPPRLNLGVRKSQISNKFSKIEVYLWWVQLDLIKLIFGLLHSLRALDFTCWWSTFVAHCLSFDISCILPVIATDVHHKVLAAATAFATTPAISAAIAAAVAIATACPKCFAGRGSQKRRVVLPV